MIEKTALALGLYLFREGKKLGARHGLLDQLLLILIANYPGRGPHDYFRLIYGDESTAFSATDKPLERLVQLKLVNKKFNADAVSRFGEPKYTYTLTAKAKKLLNIHGGDSQIFERALATIQQLERANDELRARLPTN